MKNHEEHPELSDNIVMLDIGAIPLFFGVAVFDFEGNGVVLNLHASMKEPEKFNYVLHRALGVYIFMLTSFSCIAYYVSFIKLKVLFYLKLTFFGFYCRNRVMEKRSKILSQ